ncbi:CoA ester lyase [Granulicella mallensis]|uniref:Citrate lyase subunit beta/citryl-CoA lyase n=1 Tax=Granulicella mallensis TaxID=940614 RepID=A0A7W8EBZ0_9BACT|nr:CoA ester lyase [Granulicella mallensis]MBB5066064.1 citrate lyase subunit beta/citryl-CoA lyase [Granulicella mallensis]
MMRSKLFVPADRPELFEKALRSGANAICFDLEDAVIAGRKVEARENLRSFFYKHVADGYPLLLVRTNPVGSSHFHQDIECALWPSLYAIALPKVERLEDISAAVCEMERVERLRNLLPPVRILPTIESPRGLRIAAEISMSSPRVLGLQMGFADLMEPLGIAPENTLARNQVRLMLRLAAAEGGLNCYDSAFPDFRDPVGYVSSLQSARALGFAGASCIHPSQIAAANLAFSPTEKELLYAQRVVDAARQAAESGNAVTSVDGKMIDEPFIQRARALLKSVGR